jgi:Ca-activated chloride channel homolog
MDMFRFENPSFLYLFLLIPVFILVFWLSRYYRKRSLKRFGELSIVGLLMPWASRNRPWFRFGLQMLAMCFLVLAAMNPQLGSKLEEVKREGVDIIVALDVSSSMLAEDVKPNRLERAKMSISRLIDRLEGDRIGLIVFSGQAITQVPLTTDYHAARLMLRPVSTNSIQQPGTSISAAIERAVASFASDDLTNKVLIIISDGENHADDPVAAAKSANQLGLTIFTIGIGSPEGAPIPVYNNNQLTGFQRDGQGNTIVTRYDAATLREIALVANGLFQEGRGSDLGLSQIFDEYKTTRKRRIRQHCFF